MKIFFTFALMLFTVSCVHSSSSSPLGPKPAARLAFEDQKVWVDAFWLKTPEVDQEQKLRLEVRDDKGNLVPAPKDISVSVWMETHSYGVVQPTVNPVMDKSGKPEIGVYEVSGIFFLAPGQWEVRVYMDKGKDEKHRETFLVDLGKEKLNPMDDPNSPIHQMMNKTGMDHSKHQNHGKDKEKGKEKNKDSGEHTGHEGHD